MCASLNTDEPIEWDHFNIGDDSTNALDAEYVSIPRSFAANAKEAGGARGDPAPSVARPLAGGGRPRRRREGS